MWTAIASIIGGVLNQLDQNKQGYGNSAKTYGMAMNIANLLSKKNNS